MRRLGVYLAIQWSFTQEKGCCLRDESGCRSRKRPSVSNCNASRLLGSGERRAYGYGSCAPLATIIGLVFIKRSLSVVNITAAPLRFDGPGDLGTVQHLVWPRMAACCSSQGLFDQYITTESSHY